LHRKLVDRAEVRRGQIAQVRGLLTSAQARTALNAARMDAGKVVEAVAFLDDAELARFSERASQAQADFAAGALTNTELTYIVIALATAVIILVIVAA
jgi:hypothetical protein